MRNEKAFALRIDGIRMIAASAVRQIDRREDHDLARCAGFQHGPFDIDRSGK